MSYLNRLPITSPTFWDLTVAISRLSPVEQQALLAALEVLQHLRQTDPHLARGTQAHARTAHGGGSTMTYWEGHEAGGPATSGPVSRWHEIVWALVLGAAVFGLLWLGVA